MQTINESTFQNRMHELETRITRLREQVKFNKGQLDEAKEKQIRALEDQYKLLKAELEKKEVSARMAYSTLSSSAKKAWDELWTGVERAYHNLH